MNIKAVLFDLDGTLLDSVPIILKSAVKVFADMGLPYDEVAVRKAIGIPLTVQAKQFAGVKHVEFVEMYRRVYKDMQARELVLFDGTREMLERLEKDGYQMGLVTSKARHSAEAAVESAGLADYFDLMITADDVERPKPDPEPILTACEKLRLDKRQVVYVGDSLFDIDSAQAAGVRVVAVSWGARNKNDLDLMCPDIVVDNWTEMLDWIQSKK